MHARKIRYDEEFIAPREERGPEVVEAFAAAPDADFRSPARALHEQLGNRIDELTGTAAPVLKNRLDRRLSLAIIVGASLLLWGIIAATGLLIF